MIEIRKAVADDAEVAWATRNAAINSQCAGHYPSETLEIWTGGEISARFVEELESRGYLAILDGVVVGTGIVNLDTGKIDAMFVHPTYMGNGIGKKIMSHLETLAREAGLAQLHLESSLNAAPFYRACGFKGEEVAEYHSPKGVSLDCILMIKDL